MTIPVPEVEQTRVVRTSFVAISRFAVANGMTDEVIAAFHARPHMVDHASGFQRLEVLTPHDAPDEIWLMTWWKDEASFREWHASHAYRDSHKGIPRGLKLDPSATQLRFFNVVAE
jgi:heme-degrading monooxygenase HmoA